jgi:hypothetical protein
VIELIAAGLIATAALVAAAISFLSGHGIAQALGTLGLVSMSSLVPPANTVYAGGARYDESVQTYKVKTVTNLRAGVFVITDTDDDHIKVAGAGALNVIGVLTEKNWTDPDWDPTTAPTAEDEFDVLLIGSGAWAKVRNGAAITVGDPIATSATGRAAAKAAEIDSDVGRALHTNDGSGAESDLLVVL